MIFFSFFPPLKIIDKRLHDYRVMSRLVREISLMELLSHENVVKLYETFETAESLFLILEFIPGVNLDEHLQRSGGSLSEPEARAIFRQMVTAVSYCHSRWVVHRDLKVRRPRSFSFYCLLLTSYFM
jgi:serine/threonine protein kinase